MDNLSSDGYDTIVIASGNGASILACLLASALVFSFGLYRRVVYRLALYQVLAGMAHAAVGMLQIMFVNDGNNSDHLRRACIAVGWLALYTQWVMLLFTLWITVHIFCFGVLRKNLNQLEVVYAVTSLLIPAVVAAVPLTTDSYEYHLGACYVASINASHRVAVIERFALWNGPAVIILLATSVAMAVVVMQLIKMACRKSNVGTDDQYRKAFKQLLPLAAFPVMFLVFIIPIVILDDSIVRINGRAQVLVPALLVPLWSTTSAGALIIHVSFTTKKRPVRRRSVPCTSYSTFQ